MTTSLMTLRVRPARLAVLIDRSSQTTELIGVFRFLSQLWGGRFATIIPVSSDPEPLTAFRLSKLRPEFVYAIGIDVGKWEQAVYDACQPRSFNPLTPELMQDVRKADREEFIRGDRAVIAMFNGRNPRSQNKRDLAVVNIEDTGALGTFCAAMFGVHPSDLLQEYRDEERELRPPTAEKFIDLCTAFAGNQWQSWLDANSFGLSTCQFGGGEIEPTIVVVRDVPCDLSLFWNLRMVSDHDRAPWILPVPADHFSRREVIEAIRRWLDRFDKIANYCVVTSQTVVKNDCADFIKRMEEALKDTSIQYVDYSPPKNRLPVIVPYEAEVTWPVSMDGRTIEFVPPRPKCFDMGRSSECWYVDLVNDAATRRAPMDMQLPPSTVISEILNGPCPPSFENSLIRRFGDGVDAINARCNSRKSVIRFYVPAPDEVLEELMREGSYEAVHDEKRSAYLPTIERFGSIHEAATAFSGKVAEILEVLQNKGPLLPDRIKGLCKLGAGDLPIDNYLGRIDTMLVRESARTKRLATRRFSEYARGAIPESLTLSALLEHWADRAIVKRSWKLGPCSHCGQTWFVDRLDIREPVICSNCGQRTAMPDRVPIGYALAPAVKHAFAQGIIPVVLTGRFLRNLTHRGFFWLPGMKYSEGNTYGDADIIACCDGELVFAECKCLVGTQAEASVWRDVLEQFFTLSKVAIACKARLLVLASQVEAYPEDVLREIDRELKTKIPFLILNANDLESGYRKTDEGQWMSIRNFAAIEFSESLTTAIGGQRQIRFGPMTYTKGR